MAFKVNYGLERAERNRAKQAKKEAKALARKAGAQMTDENTAPVPGLDETPELPSAPASDQ